MSSGVKPLAATYIRAYVQNTRVFSSSVYVSNYVYGSLMSQYCTYMRFCLFPHRKTAHKAIVIVNTMMNERKGGDVAIGTGIGQEKKPDEM